MTSITASHGSIGIGAHRGLEAAQQPAQQDRGLGAALRDSIRSGLDSLGQRFTDAFQRITRTGNHTTAACFARANPYAEALAQAPRAGENGFHDGGILARHGDAISAKLDSYRETIGSKLSGDEMRALINTGEHLVNAISRGESDGGRIALTVGGQDFDIASNTHTTRAISWYLTAKAAEMELMDGGDHMVTKGSMLMKDPGNKLFDFLNAAPTSYGRCSTHFNERATDDNPKHHLAFWKPMQRGIEDFEGKLPCGGGALLFNKLKNEELFMKFEEVGMPTVFRLSGHGDAHQTVAQKIGNVFRSMAHCIEHALNYRGSRGDTNASGAGVHREHAHKDHTRDAVFEPFTKVMNHLEPAQDGQKLRPEDVVKTAKKQGTSYMEEMLDGPAMGAFRIKEGHAEAYENDLAAARDSIGRFHREQGHDFGAARKGMETHVSLQTYPSEYFTVHAGQNGASQVE